MPKPKKPAPFMVFVKEYQQKFPNMALETAIEKADGQWRKMSNEEKSHYKSRAKTDPILTNTPQEKYSSQGVPLSQLDKEKQDLETKEQLIKKEIQNIILAGTYSNTLASQKFYFIMANYFIRNATGLYLPAEIAICEYSLEDGITNKYHSLINPGKGVFGHAYEAMEHAKNTHNLPLPPNALGESDFNKLYSDILKFLKSGNVGRKEIPPVFTLDTNLPVLKSILNYLSDDESPLIKVYSLHYLFYILKKTTSEIGDTKHVDSIHITNAILDRDYYEYQSGIACELHESIDTTNFCALSYVTRWAYTFSDNICMDLGITIKPGIHVSVDADLSVIDNIPDDDSYDTESVYSMRTISTNFTEPVLEQNFSISATGEEFPKLEKYAKNKKKNIPDTSLDETVSGIENMTLNSQSRWSERLKGYPREPNETYNNYSISMGRGTSISFITDSDFSVTLNETNDNIVTPRERRLSPNDHITSNKVRGRGRLLE